LEDKGDRLIFVDGKFLVWPKGSSIDYSRAIEVYEGRLYRLLNQLAKELVHDVINPCEICHRIYIYLHYMDFPTLNQMVLGVPKLQMEHEEVCKGYALGKNVKKSFPCSESRSKEILDLVDFYVCG